MICDECDGPMAELPNREYLDPVFIRGRTIALHGITVEHCPRCNYDAVVYPRLGQLVPLVRDHPETRDFFWNEAADEWTCRDV